MGLLCLGFGLICYTLRRKLIRLALWFDAVDAWGSASTVDTWGTAKADGARLLMN